MFTNNNYHLIFDLEATSFTNKTGEQVNNYIIEIGAVMLDPNLKEIGSFSSLVQPEEIITPFIEKLTNITNEQVQLERLWDIVGKDFSDWAFSLAPSKKIILGVWGSYFDIPLLKRVYQKYNMEYPFGAMVLDIKSLAMFWSSTRGENPKDLALPKIAKILGVAPEEAYHKAIVDARTTANIFKAIIERMQFLSLKAPNEPIKHYKIQEVKL